MRRQAQREGTLTCGNHPTCLKKKVPDTIRKQSHCERLEERVILDPLHAYVYLQSDSKRETLTTGATSRKGKPEPLLASTVLVIISRF